jgi:hypothetical protein
MTAAIQVIELGLDLSSSNRSDVGSDDIQFTAQQSQFIKEALEWLEFPQSGQRLMALHGFAGAGKSFVVNHLLAMARQSGILVGDVWATAPTHQAKKILEKASSGTGAGISQFMTSHSFFGLRPQKVTFEAHHEDKLEELLAIEEQYRTPDQCGAIDSLIWRKNAALERLEEFLPTKLKKGAEHVRLVIGDEAFMNNQVLSNLYFELPFLYDMHPDLQILFLGDPAQLPPIKEKESLVVNVPRFTALTQVVRNKGNILAYCTAVRSAFYAVKGDERIGYSSAKDLVTGIGVTPELMSVLSAQPGGLESAILRSGTLNGWTIERGTSLNDLTRLHYEYDSEDVAIMPQREILSQIKDVMESGDSVRFLAGTNDRCRQINELVRYALKGIDAGLHYYPGDTVLTLSAVKRGFAYGSKTQPGYGVKCDGDMQDHTSTLFELGDELGVGDYVKCGDDGGIRLDENSFSYTSVYGTTFNRSFFRYRPYDSGEKFGLNQALCLINPDQYQKWLEECTAAWARAQTTQTRSKKSGARGQAGDGAKAVWDEFELKNWEKKLDGSVLTYDEYKKIRSRLWVEAFTLAQFSDKASFSYCSTVHRAQGITSDVAILDEKTLMRSEIGKYSEDFDIRKLIYTAASRARKQLIVMV